MPVSQRPTPCDQTTMDTGQGCRGRGEPTSLSSQAPTRRSSALRLVLRSSPVSFMSPRSSHWRPIVGAGLAFALSSAAACDEEEPADTTSDTEDRIVYEHTHKTLAAVPLLAYVAELFKGDPSWRSLDPDAAARIAVAVTRARIDLVLGSFQCEREFDSNGTSMLSGSFTSCQLANFDLEGDFSAELAIETGPCPDDVERECSVGVRWTLGSPEFTVGNEKNGSSSFSGPVILRDSILDANARMTWETQSGFSLQAAQGEQFTTRSTASWLVDDDTNCMDISLDARLELPEIADEAIESIEIGEIVISAADVHYCPTHCPTSGNVEMAYGRGSILSWAYDGNDEVVVTGPGGREFSAGLPCPAAPM